MDTFTLTYTCTCGDFTEEIFMDNTASKIQLLQLVEAAVLADVEDVKIIRNKADGTQHDETGAILAALAVKALMDLL